MGLGLRKVADTIMSDLGMGEDQGKIDALEQYLRRFAKNRKIKLCDWLRKF